MHPSSVPVASQVVPESLLKKRKSQEKAREARAADLQKKRTVSLPFLQSPLGMRQMLGDDTPPPTD